MSSPDILSDRYELGETLGYGGMSEVHRGRDVRLGRDVAVKVLRADLARDPTFQLRFRREAQNAAALNHPAIVAVYDTGETESESGALPYIVMEYVEGRTLRDIVKSDGPLQPRRAMEIMADACAALDFSHRHGIVHRDVKPANIMINQAGAVKVMDFGIARALADGQAAVTQTAAVIGTAQYLSPEQARGEVVDARSDVYAAGCVLYELLTGEPPFTGDSPVAVAYQHVREDPTPPAELNEQVPPELNAVVLRSLSKNPANRYQSAAEMRSDLVRVLSGQQPKAPMVMSEQERTAMMAGAAPTDVLPQHDYEPTAFAEDEQYDHRRKRRKGRNAALLTTLGVVVLALVAWLTITMVNGPSGPEMRTLPNVVGQVERQAMDQLRSQQFRPVIRDQESAPQDNGKVLRQNPTAQQAPLGSQVTLFVGRGPGQTQVPNLYGKTKQEAQDMLRNAGLELNLADERTVEVDDPSLVGRIVKQDPNASLTVTKGSTITITVGKAPELIELSDVRGLPYSNASSLLRSQGFQVVENQVDSTEPARKVLDQSPSPSSKVRKGSTVTLTVSKGNQFQMPDLRGKSASAAKQQLSSIGWSGTVQEQKVPVSNISEYNKVKRTDPGAGSQLRKDQTVTLYVGDFSSSSTSSTTTTTPSEEKPSPPTLPFP